MGTTRFVALAGGVGAARFLRGLVHATDAESVTVIGNTGDDTTMYGLHISPDLDTVTYTLAGIVGEVGWGIDGDTYTALERLGRMGIDTWFRLGDRDIGTHMARTHWLAQGVSPTEIADRIRRSLGVAARIIPMSDDPVRTRISTAGGVEMDFQEYFVRRRHSDEVAGVEFVGAASSRPAPGVLESIGEAERIIVCPSNPVLSIGPILAVPGIREALANRRERVTAISPLVGGKALKGPAADLMPVVGAQPTAAGVAGLYRDFCGTMVLDHADAELAASVREMGYRTHVTQTIMHSPADSKQLATEVLAL